MKAFIKLNKRTMTFTGHDFFTGELLFKNAKQIPLPKDQCIIYHGQGNNIHPSLWKSDWFKSFSNLAKICETLGWKGGTIHDACHEINKILGADHFSSTDLVNMNATSLACLLDLVKYELKGKRK